MTTYTRLLTGSLLCLLACQGGEMSAPDHGTPAPLAGAPVSLTRFRSDSFAYAVNSGITSPEQLVVRDAAAWSDLWQRIHATTTPEPPLPEVDFTREMVIAAALGNRSTGGYDILLAQAREDASGLQIDVVETSPGAGCATTQAFTQPVDLARAPRQDGPVHFIETQRINPCTP